MIDIAMVRHSSLGALVALGLMAACSVRNQGLVKIAGADGGGSTQNPTTVPDGARPAPSPDGGGTPTTERDGPRLMMMMSADAAPVSADAEVPAMRDAARADAPPSPPDMAPPPADRPPPPPPDMGNPTGSANLVAYWKFDESAGASTAADSSGNGNDGTLSMLDPATAWEQGHLGNAIHIHDFGHVVMVKASASLDTMANAFTMAAWVKRVEARAGTYASIVSRQLGTQGQDMFNFGFVDGRLRFNGDRLTELIAPDRGPAVGTWGHVAITYDGQRLRMYINAMEVAATGHMGNIGPDDRPLLIGGNQNGGQTAEPLEGVIDELRLYNRALAPTEIAALAQ
jgi:hypothetical protein